LTCECGYQLCGKRLFTQGKYESFKYRCNGVWREVQTGCTNRRTIDATYLDAAAWTKLVQSLDPEIIKRSARDYVAQQSALLEPTQQRLSLAIAEQQDARRMAEEYVKLAARASAAAKLELLARYEDDAEKELARAERLDREIEDLQEKLTHVAKYDEREIDRVLAELNERIERGKTTFAQKRKFIEWANVKGKLNGERIRFTLEIGITFEVERQPTRGENYSSVNHSSPDTAPASSWRIPAVLCRRTMTTSRDIHGRCRIRFLSAR
jgi:hypothetical protein